MRILSSLMVLALAAVSAGAADRPKVKLTFSLPTENTTYLSFDPAPLDYHHQGFATPPAHPVEGDRITDRTVSSHAVVHPQPRLPLKPWSARLRLQGIPGKKFAPLALDLSWTSQKERTLVQVWGSEFITVGHYRPSCLPHWEGPCWDHRGLYDSTSDYRDHMLTLHVLRTGLGYDVLYRTKHFSLEPGIGVEWSLARHQRRTEGYFCESSFANCTSTESTDRTTWDHGKTGYLSLSGDVYPLGKRRFLAVGASTRWLVTSGTLNIRDGTLLGNYEVPIRSQRFSTSFHATLAF